MSYVVTARRWRPQTFADLVGQEHIARTLSNAIRADRVAHAFLFTGLRGVGKTTAARILAKALNCEKGPAIEPCNKCTNCTEITAGRAVDVLEIDGASNTGVDDVREIIDNVIYQPAKSTFKIYIIDEVHMLSNNAFNALLKTLEEPPPHVKFIFATTDPQKLPATVQSRCQRYDFRRISLEQVVSRLKAIAKDQKLKISEKVLFTLAREGEGSMRDSQSLFDQIAAGSDGKVSDEDALAALGVADRQVVYDLGAAIVGRDCLRAVEVLDGVHRLGCDMRRLTRDLLEHFRNVAVAHVTRGKVLPEIPAEEVESLLEQARALQPADADRCFRILMQTDEEVGRSAYPKLVLEMTVIRLASLEPLVPVDDLLRRIEKLGSADSGSVGGGSQSGGSAAHRGGRATAQAARRATPTASTGSGRTASGRTASGPREDRADTGARTDSEAGPSATPRSGDSAPGAGIDGAAACVAYREYVGSRVPTLGSHLALCGEGSFDGKVLEIEALRGFRADYLADPTQTSGLEELAAEFFGRSVRVRVQPVDKVGPEKQESAAPEPTAAERAEAVMTNPTVQAALDILDGELTEVRQRRSRDRGERI